MVKLLVTLTCLVLLVGLTVCDLTCYECTNCKEDKTSWKKCTQLPDTTTQPTSSSSNPTSSSEQSTGSSPTPASSSIKPPASESSTVSSILPSANKAAKSDPSTTPSASSTDATSKKFQCAYVKYKDEDGNEVVDRFCTALDKCESMEGKYKANSECKVCDTDSCNKDGAGSIHSWAITTILVVAISKTLFFN